MSAKPFESLNRQVDKIASDLIAMSILSRGEYSYMVMQAGAILREISQGMSGGHFDAGFINDKADKLKAAAMREAKDKVRA